MHSAYIMHTCVRTYVYAPTTRIKTWEQPAVSAILDSLCSPLPGVVKGDPLLFLPVCLVGICIADVVKI